jgi:hypothetical protein
MRIVIVAAAVTALAGCSSTSVREQALAECGRQAEAMGEQLAQAGVDADQFCSCVTDGITDDSSIADANEAITGRTQQCVMEAVQSRMGG